MMDKKDSFSNLKNAKIMIVDDEPINIEVVQAFLEDEGYSDFVTVEDSTQAIDSLIKSKPDLLLLDLMMPNVSGFDILSAVRMHAKFQHLPIIILTAATDTENKIKALDLGATDFLAKPLDQSELVLRIRNTLGAKAYQDQLAFYDPLTKLPNRELFMEEFSWAVDSAIRFDERLALLNIEIDNFNSLKDTIGIVNSDQVLQLTAERIERTIRKADLAGFSTASGTNERKLFHFDSHVFTVLLSRLDNVETAATVAERILTEIRTPIPVDNRELMLTASAGIVSCPDDSRDISELLLLASSAKDYAKKNGGGKIQFSSKAISSMYEQRLEMESQLHKAIENREFVLYYQPKVSFSTGRIEGAEALIRWPKDDRLIPPGDFIPLAEETGMIVPIGLWCLQEGCRQLKSWQENSGQQFSLSINLSAKQLADDQFLKDVQDVVEESGIDPQSITLELTESLLIDNIEEKILLLQRLKKIGFKISIDDFGTGYSSLSYLRRLPIDELKIDRSFVMEISDHRQSRAIVATIVYLANSLRMTTVAEGIEQKRELDFIKGLKCDQYQGFLFSRPIPADDFIELLQQHNDQSN